MNRHTTCGLYIPQSVLPTDFIRVIIVPLVLLLSPVVVEAGLGSGHTVIGYNDLPRYHGASVLCLRAGAATLSSDILFTPETQDGSCECLGPIAN